MASTLSADSAVTAELLHRAQAGDSQVLDALLTRHLPYVKQSIQRRLGGKLRARLDASDVAQETQHTVVQRFDDFCQRRPMPFRLWLIKTAHERIVDVEREHLHTAKRAVDRELPLPDASSVNVANQLLAKAPPPEGIAMRKEMASQVRRCLATLSETDREILMLRCFEGLKNTEVAAMLELQPETTKKRFTRALLRMQSALRQAGIQEAN